MSWNSGACEDDQWEFPGGRLPMFWYDAFSPNFVPPVGSPTLDVTQADTVQAEPTPSRQQFVM